MTLPPKNGAADPVAVAPPEPPAAASGIELSVVIVVYKTPEYLRRCLDALETARIALPWEAIVIDNAPETGDCRSVAAGRERVTYIANQSNVGFGRACNQGMRAARGRYYVMLNPDMEVRPGSLEELHALAEREPDVGIVAPRLHYADGTLQESCRTFYTWRIFLLRRTFLGKIFRDSQLIRRHLMLDWDHESVRDIDWCMGACMLARREAVDEVGMMDERFFMYFEDVDWCYRMHQRGWRVVYNPQARMVHHYQRASAGWKPSRGLLLHLGSTFRYYEKWSFLLYWLKLRSAALRRVALFLSDVAMVVLAFVLAYSLRSLLAGYLTKPMYAFEAYARFLVFTTGVAAATFLSFGLYRERMGASFVENGLAVGKALAWTSMIMMAATFLFSVRLYSRIVVLLFFPLALLLVTLGRVALLRAVESVRRRDLNLRRVGILGPPGAVADLLDRFERHGRFGMEPIVLPSPPPEEGPRALVRRVRLERLQEIVVFEDWEGDVPALLERMKGEATAVRLIPRLRDHLPRSGGLTDFMGFASVALAERVTTRLRSPSRRLGDALAAVSLALIWLIPYLLTTLARAMAGRGVGERVEIRGWGGRALTVTVIPGLRDGCGAFRSLLHWYPSLPQVVSGSLSLAGIYPFRESQWNGLDPAYRAHPPEAPPAILGPWTVAPMSAEELCEWNRRYPGSWSAAGDFRIFWSSFLGIRETQGGTR